MPLSPRGTEDFGSWAAWRQGVLAPHLVKTDMGHRGFVWDPFGPTSKWKTILQTRFQSLRDLISFLLSEDVSCFGAGCRRTASVLAIVGTMLISWEFKARPGVCPEPSSRLLPPPHLNLPFVIWKMVAVTPRIIGIPCGWLGNSRIRLGPIWC